MEAVAEAELPGRTEAEQAEAEQAEAGQQRRGGRS